MLTSRWDAGRSCPARVVATSSQASRLFGATPQHCWEADKRSKSCVRLSGCALDDLHTRRDDDDVRTWLLAIMRNRFIIQHNESARASSPRRPSISAQTLTEQ